MRPLFRQILPVLEQLQPSLKDFTQSSPQLTTAFTVINELFNELAYNPGPNQGSFLFYLDWANHDLNSVVAQGDAHGAEGQALLYFNCAQVPILHAAAASRSDGESDPRPAQPADRGTVQVGADSPARRQPKRRACAPGSAPTR